MIQAELSHVITQTATCDVIQAGSPTWNEIVAVFLLHTHERSLVPGCQSQSPERWRAKGVGYDCVKPRGQFLHLRACETERQGETDG